MAANNWCTIESDPGVFTELIQEMGVKGVQVEELYDLDTESVNAFRPVYGLIFLFKWRSGDKDENPVDEDSNNGVFFANQVINNACATQAILSILMNRPDIDLGSELTNFKTFTMDFPANLKGLAIGNSDLIRKAHNSFARAEPFVVEGRAAEKDDDVYHFISYVPIKGKLYELDGLKAGPICLGDCDMDNWLEAALPQVRARIDRYSAMEIRFNLMGLIRNRVEVLQEELTSLEKEKERAVGLIQTRIGGPMPSQEELEELLAAERAKADGPLQVPEIVPGNEANMSAEDLSLILASVTEKLEQIKAKRRTEEERFMQWKVENVRRKHNYIPFIIQFLKILAEKGELMPLVDKATKRARHS